MNTYIQIYVFELEPHTLFLSSSLDRLFQPIKIRDVTVTAGPRTNPAGGSCSGSDVPLPDICYRQT